MHVMKCHEGDNHTTRAISLGKSHGVGRRLRAAPCRLPGSGATEPAEGDGIDPESVALDLCRGENRPLWDISRHLREAVPRIGLRETVRHPSCLPRGVPSHACRGGPRGRGPCPRELSLGVPRDADCHPWAGSRRRPSPLGRSVPSARLGCHGTRRGRRNRPRIRRP